MTEKLFDEEFAKFIYKWCKGNYAHLCDTDENDGQMLREFVEDKFIEKDKVLIAISEVCECTCNEVNDIKCRYHEIIERLGLNP